MKDSLLNDIAASVEDIRLLFRDYGFNIDTCAEDEDECESNDAEIHKLHVAYNMMREVLDEAGF